MKPRVSKPAILVGTFAVVSCAIALFVFVEIRKSMRFYELRGATMSNQDRASDQEWRSKLTPEEYHVTREKGTERAFTGKYWNNHAEGTYKCVCCGAPLFESKTKFESGTGWPSFYEPARQENVETDTDASHGMVRSEVRCHKCEAHLGHVFDDGPAPTGLQYCINSAALNFEKKSD